MTDDIQLPIIVPKSYGPQEEWRKKNRKKYNEYMRIYNREYRLKKKLGKSKDKACDHGGTG